MYLHTQTHIRKHSFTNLVFMQVGDLVWLTPGHCDPTVNLYDWLIGVREGRVEYIWPVLGRGPGV